MKKHKTLPFLIIGAVLIVIGIIIAVSFTVTTKGMIPVEGKIIDLNGVIPMVFYQVDGNSYSTWMNAGSSGYQLRAPFQLLVDPADPTRVADPAGTRSIALILSGAGLLILAFSLLAQHLLNRSAQLATRLRTAGIRKTGTVTRVRQSHTDAIKGQFPWIVEAECEHPRTGETICLIDRLVWQTHLKAGDQVDVLFDPDNDNLYMMDIDSRPPTGPAVYTMLHP